MSRRTLIRNASIVNEGRIFRGSVLIEGERISAIEEGAIEAGPEDHVVEASGKFLLPGVIDDQVHFREPGMTHKEDIRSGSIAALAGGVTSFMEMPNTLPPTTDRQRLEEKFAIGKEGAAVNHSFFIGATTENIDAIADMDPNAACGIKIFLGSSTGDLLFDDPKALDELFEKCGERPILAHCEREGIIRNNLERYRRVYGDEIPMRYHPIIRSHEACYRSSSDAVRKARKKNAHFQVLHISTGQECDLFDPGPVTDKRITSEACVHHIFFDQSAYETKGSWVKWNPAIKSAADRDRIIEALNEDRIDLIATDHAPHTEEEKTNGYFQAPSGAPLVQHGLTVMFELYRQRRFTLQKIVEKMCHNPAERFRLKERGYIRKGYHADLVLLDPDRSWTVRKENLHYKCGWSPLEGETFNGRVSHTFVNGTLAYRHDRGTSGEFLDTGQGKRLEFDNG